MSSRVFFAPLKTTTFRRSFHSSSALTKKVEEAAIVGKLEQLTLNFAIPHRAIVNKKEVKSVTIPGRDGVMGVERNAPPIVAELKPGVVRVDFLDNTTEEIFIPGGFAFKHANNLMDISAPEGVKLEHIDADALRARNTEAQQKLSSAAAGSKEAAEAKITLELYQALSKAAKIAI
jgi:F0F1-type ATP synthase epsilon subunit